jgi:hypothetical protein
LLFLRYCVPEIVFRLILAIARTMHTKDVIAASDLILIDTILLEKYRPLLGNLHSTNTTLVGNTTHLGGFSDEDNRSSES